MKATEPAVIVVQDGGIFRVMINRADSRNALNAQTIKELTAAIRRASARDDARVILLTGSGDQAFCAGADLKELTEGSARSRKAFFTALAGLLSAMRRSRIPLIARVHGYALAGGCGLVAACDMAFASDDAIFGLPEINIGMVPMVVLAALLPVIGPRPLATLALTGERIDANTAKDIGLVTRVIPKGQLDAECDRAAAHLASRPPHATAACRRALVDVTGLSTDRALKEFAKRMGAFSSKNETLNGIRAFLHKKPGA